MGYKIVIVKTTGDYAWFNLKRKTHAKLLYYYGILFYFASICIGYASLTSFASGDFIYAYGALLLALFFAFIVQLYMTTNQLLQIDDRLDSLQNKRK